MKTHSVKSSTTLSCTGLLLVAWVLLVPWRTLAVGAFTPLATNAPAAIQLMLLLSDGTVMAANAGGSNWYRLTPDSHGHYINGAWTARRPMNSTRLYYSSAVLQDGRVFVAGAEYGTGWGTAEIYNPSSDSWTPIPVPPGLLNTNNTIGSQGQNQAGFTDSICKILANGNVLVAPNFPITPNGTLIYNPTANSWSAGPVYLRSQNEASWVKLPDDSILSIDKNTTNSERYITASNTWINDGNVPVSLYDTISELGAGLLLSDGRAFFLGGNGNTALYTPSGNTNKGSWAAGANIPNGMGASDAAAAMMVNGKIIGAFGQAGTLNAPTFFYEYDPVANSFAPVFFNVYPPVFTDSAAPFQTIMLDLPDGTVLYSDSSSQLYVYTPDNTPLPAGKPMISSITANADGSYHLTGTKLNGISEGAAYGDDAQMDSNYSLVRLTDGSGNVYYAGTYNWSSTSVMTGNTPVTTEFTLPAAVAAGGGGTYSLVVVANGNSSDPVTFAGPVWVDFTYTGFLQFGTFNFPYKTLAGGVNNVSAGGTILLKPGSSSETITLSKPMTITAVGGTASIGHGH